MTWRKAMNRRRDARLAQELPAVARPSEGEGVSTPSQRFLPNLVGAAKAAAPATFSEGPKKKGYKAHVINKEELAPLVAQGLNDEQIGKLYGHSQSWTQHLRSIYGITPACGPGGYPRGAPRPLRRRPVPVSPKVTAAAPVPKQTREEMHTARYAAFFAEHGDYQSYSDADIEIREMGYRVAALRHSRPINHTAAFCGDPAPNRPRA